MTVTFAGGTCGLIGPNGAGKTTFFNVLSGFVRPVDGTGHAFGDDLLAMADFRRARWGVRRTFQTEQAIANLSVFENVLLVHEHTGGSRATRRQDVIDAVAFVGLETQAEPPGRHARRRPAPPGRGRPRRRRHAAPRPARRAGRRPARRGDRAPRRGDPADPATRPARSSILVDHDMSLVSACCATTAVLDFGRLIASGPTAEVLRDEHVIRAYLGTEEAASSDIDRPSAGSRIEEPRRCLARPGGGRAARRLARDRRRARSPTLLGPNGTGKSTLVLTVAGVLRPTAGASGSATTTSPSAGPSASAAAGVAVVPEGRRLLPDLTVADNLRVATYALAAGRRRAAASTTRSSCSPSCSGRLGHDGPLAVGRRAADGGAGPGPGVAPDGAPRRRALARPRAGRRQAPRADAGAPSPRPASACC